MPRALRCCAALSVLITMAVAQAQDLAAPQGGKLALRGEAAVDDLLEGGVTPLRKWFFLGSLVNVYPRLKSEELISNLFEKPLQLIAPGFDDIKTFTDMRDDGLLWPPHIGVGRVLSPHWSWFLQGGWSAGTVRTKQDAWTIIGLPIHNDFAITRGAIYAGIGLDWFPKGMPEQRKYNGIWDRLKETKPNVGWRLTWTRASFDADIKLGFGTGQGPNFLSLKLDDEWSVLSSNLVVGADMPLTKYHQFSVNAGYAYFWEQAFDFKGPVITVGWKYFFH